MSFQTAIPHLEAALTHAKAGNAAKTMHHIGHAMVHVRGMTNGAGGGMKSPLNMAPAKPKAPTMPSDSDGDEPTDGMASPVAGSLRARLAGMGK